MANANEITVMVEVPRTECNPLYDYLNLNGVRAAKNFGVMNAIPPPNFDPQKIAEMAKAGTPYLMVTGIATVLVQLFKAYATTHKKKLKIVKNSKGGVEISAENITPKELEEVGVFDLIKIAPPDDSESE